MKNRKLKYLLLSLLLVCTMTFGIVAYAAGGRAASITVNFMYFDANGQNTDTKSIIVEDGETIGEACERLGEEFPQLSGKATTGTGTANVWMNKDTVVTEDTVPTGIIFVVSPRHNHNEIEIEAAVPATCVTVGKTAVTGCDDPDCTDTREGGEEIPVDSENHENLGVWADGEDSDDPVHVAVCSSCSQIVTAPHEYDDDDDMTCNVCGHDRTGEEIVDPECKHENMIPLNDDLVKEPTCTEAGIKALFMCMDCDGYFYDMAGTVKAELNEDGEADTRIPALGHDVADVEWSKNATEHYKVCKNGCGEPQEEAEHTFGTDNICTVCQYEKPETPVEHEHNLVATSKESVCAAIPYYHCDAEDCDVAGGLYAEDETGTKVLDGLDAVKEYTAHKEVDQKYDESQHWDACKACKEVVGTATNHKLSDKEGTAVAATCAKDGKEADQVCSDCSYTKTGATIDKSTVAHKPGTEWKSDKDGHWHVCTVCDTEVEKTNHTPGAAATETTAQTCTVCGYEIAPATGAHTHTMTKTEAKAATCTEDGNQEYYTCSGCDKVFKDEAGTEETTVADMTVAKLGHDMQEVEGTYQAPTCTEAGKAADQKCSRCDVTEAGGEIAAAGHKWEEDKWMTDKDEHWHICSVCQEKKDQAAHVPGPEATETEAQRCTVCDYILNPATGEHTHNLTLVEAVEPGHATTGHEAYYACDGCSKIFRDAEGTDEIASLEDITIPATSDHDFGEWVVTKEPTTTEEGTKERTCSVCGEKEVATIPVLDPSNPEPPVVSDEPKKTEDPKTEAPNNNPTNAPKPTTNVSPKTGDQSNMVIWMVLMLAGTTGTVSYFVSKKRRNEN